MDKKQVRRAQTISPFGVGAIIDIEGESLVAADITRWKDQGEDIREPRLERVLRVDKFKMGPAAPDHYWSASDRSPGIPYFRFPQWLFCPRCRKMDRWSIKRERGEPPECQTCTRSRLVPMRFVMACPRGHLSDVPWSFWAHSHSKNKCERPELEFRTLPGGSGLEYLQIRCNTCDARRSLEGIATPDSLKELRISCPGSQPWQMSSDRNNCDAVPQVLQRGATNLTFALTISCIDIPPYSNWATFSEPRLKVTSTPEYQIIKSATSNPLVQMLVDQLASQLSMSPADIWNIINAERREQKIDPDGTDDRSAEEELFQEEFKAFLAPDVEADPRDHFIRRRVPLNNYAGSQSGGQYNEVASRLVSYLDTLIQITRLREVRVLRGFSRLAPASAIDEEEGTGTFSVYNNGQKMPPLMVPADLNGLRNTSRWLPAIEVFGEGIFFNLNELILQQWEARPDILARTRILQERHRQSQGRFLPEPTPRFLLLHTLAHLLIRQLSFECGYTLASLRERIYAAEPSTGFPMAGILIYTAAGDAEGTLGGLVREGEADRMLSTIIKALQAADWCSSDPLCRESNGQGMNAMNLAACHSCALLPETSCSISNRLLDRAALIGSTDNPASGFFSELIDRILQTMGVDQ